MARELENISFFGEETDLCPKSQNVSYGQSNVKDALDDHESRITTLEGWGETNITLGAGRNLYNKASGAMNLSRHKIDATGALAGSSADAQKCAKVPVTPGKRYIVYFSDGRWGNNNRVYSFLNSSGEPLVGAKQWTLINNDQLPFNGDDIVIDNTHRLLTAPEGSTHLAIQTGNIANSDWPAYDVSQTLMVEEGTHVSEFAEYDGNYIVKINGKPIKAADNDRKLMPDIPLNTYVLGDSIATQVEGIWPRYLTQKFSFKYFMDVAKGGATWGIRADATNEEITAGNMTSASNNMLTQVYKLIALVNGGSPTPQLIIIHAGTNDITREFANQSSAMASDENGTTVGDADTTFNYANANYRDWSSISPVDPRTQNIVGGMRIVIEKIRSTWPYCKIVVTTPTQRATNISSDYSLTTIFWKGVNQIKKAAQYLAVPVIDLACESGVCPYNFGIFLRDSLHPNGNGGLRYADIIGRWLMARYGNGKTWYN